MNKLLTQIFFILIIGLLCNSCAITNTPGFYNGYKVLSDSDKQNVVFLDTTLKRLDNNGQIIALNGEQLRHYALSVDTLLIYRWSPNCSSKSCILISACQDYCTKKNYKLVVVAEYYDMEKMKAQNIGDLPILIPDHLYYKNYYANRLNRLFYKDLLADQKLSKEHKYDRFLFLNRGILFDSTTTLINIAD